MEKRKFSSPMRKSETIIGWIYLFVHIFLLSTAVVWAVDAMKLPLDDAQINLIYYIISFAVVLCCMFRFLRKSFSDLCDNLGRSVSGVIMGYAAYYGLTLLIVMGISALVPEFNNPNAEAVGDSIKLNANVMKAVAIFLAPVVEEVLFRGVVFGSIRKKSRVAAYIVSALLFSVYHLWSFILADFQWTTLLYILQYVPASLALAWCYERGRNIWAPIFLHMLVNLISVSVQLLM